MGQFMRGLFHYGCKIAVSMHDESLYVESAIHTGVCGCITKQEATRKILQTILWTHSGDSV
jgi:DNA-binding NarL/FixJ family response regulator